MIPTVPVKAAGWRIEPPVSVAVAPRQSRAATAAAEPPEEPPGTICALEPVRRQGETSVILELMTREHGRHLGLVHGGRSRRMQPVLQAGNRVQATWRARLDESLGAFAVEPVESVAARLMAGVLGWDQEQTEAEVANYRKRVAAERESQLQPDDESADRVRLEAPDIAFGFDEDDVVPGGGRSDGAEGATADDEQVVGEKTTEPS